MTEIPEDLKDQYEHYKRLWDRKETCRAFPEQFVNLIEQIATLRQERDAAQITLGMREGTLNMAVARLGGIVEGNPTGRHNFLQRIDELIAKEATLDEMRKPVTPMEWSQHCPRNVGGHVLPGNGIDIANAIIQSRAQDRAVR